jgi:hypothetical protein
MDILFAVVIGWLFLNQYNLYTQTAAWHYFVACLGAFLSLLFFAVRDSGDFAGILILLGPILVFAGLASAVSFGGKLEVERVQGSSWKDLLVGQVPAHLRKRALGERTSGILLASFSLFAALIVFLGGKLSFALSLTVIGVVYAIYSFRHASRS